MLCLLAHACVCVWRTYQQWFYCLACGHHKSTGHVGAQRHQRWCKPAILIIVHTHTVDILILGATATAATAAVASTAVTTAAILSICRHPQVGD